MTPFMAEFIRHYAACPFGRRRSCQCSFKRYQRNNSGWIVITTGWALAVFVGVTVAGPYQRRTSEPGGYYRAGNCR